MHILYILGGVALVILGIGQCIIELKIFIKGKPDRLGNNIKLLGVAITLMMIGGYLIIHYI